MTYSYELYKLGVVSHQNACYYACIKHNILI